MVSENDIKEEVCATAAKGDSTEAQAFRSSPIQMGGDHHNSMRAGIDESKKEVRDEGNTTTAAQNYKSCPIKVEDLRNSLRTSIASKRSSMTQNELQFVQCMLQESLGEDELETMDEVLRCDQTFFHQRASSTNEQKPTEGIKSSSEQDKNNSTSMPKISSRSSLSECQSNLSIVGTTLGSKKRQDYLEARKKQSAEQVKKRVSGLWKKAGIAGRMAGRLALASKQKARQQQALLLLEPVNDQNNAEEEAEAAEALPLPKPETRRPVFLRDASVNVYGGEGFEIGAEAFGVKLDASEEEEGEKDDAVEETSRTFSTLSAFDEVTHIPRGEGFRRASVNIYGGDGFEVAEEDLFEKVYDGEGRKSYEDYDPWLFQETDQNGKRRDFTILGTSHDDVECHPHVLSPVQMDCFQPFLPNAKKGESFWLKYSLVRDGASTISFLKQVRASPYTLLAMETVDGEVFGGFFSSSWTVRPEYFGTGECFLWRMKHSRKLPGSEDNEHPEGSLVEQIEKESDLEIFPSEVYYGNNYFQMCHQDKIASGGGTTSVPKDFGSDRGGSYEPHQIGFGLQLGDFGSLLDGSSSPSLTFRNPPLSKIHSDGSTFELVNLEAWGFTPCQTEKEARILEYKNMFFRQHSR